MSVTNFVYRDDFFTKQSKSKDNKMNEKQKEMTLIIFSNDMDKAIAAFILATGAASSGMKVNMFFTFWGLSLLRKKNYSRKGKTLIERVFGSMLPEGPDGTRLSKMNFFGAGTKMMKSIMRKKKIFQLNELMDMAVSLETKIVACTTSMEMMGIKKEELIDNIEVGGVVTYLGSARESAINLFI
jgi:peroxiredoxin family protein